MANDIIQNEDENLLLTVDEQTSVRLDINSVSSGDSTSILLELNNQDDSVDFRHDEIVIVRKSLNNFEGGDSSLSFDTLIEEIGKLRDEFNQSLSDYLLIESFYEYYSNREDVSQYIFYNEAQNLLYCEKNFASKGSFILFYDEDNYSGSGGGSSGSGEGTLDHSQLSNRDLSSQHPISAITGLEIALEGKLSVESISDWALESVKPSYSWSEIGDKPDVYHTENANLFTVNWRAKNVYAAGYMVMFTTDDSDDSDLDSGGGSGTIYHNQLENRNLDDQHAISSITGLTATLSGKLDLSAISSWALESSKPTYTWSEISDKPDLYHSGNANLFTVDWRVKNLYAAESVVIYSSTDSDGSDSDSDSSGGVGGTYYHDQLQNRDLDDQHTISSITGLIAELSGKLGFSDIYSWALQSSKPAYTWSEISDKPDLYHFGNANLFTVDWRVKNLYAAEGVVIYSSTDADGSGSDSDSSTATGGTYYHDQLQNRNLANQHSIYSITGLSTAIADAAESAIWSEISDIPSWIGASKPTYSWSELYGVPSWIGSDKPTYSWSEITYTSSVWTAANFDPDDKVDITDYRLTNARPASDVYSWAKSSEKPEYNFSEISEAPSYQFVSDKVHRKAIFCTANSSGYISRVSIGADRSSSGYGSGVISIGTNDGGTTYKDFVFSPHGNFTVPGSVVMYSTN